MARGVTRPVRVMSQCSKSKPNNFNGMAKETFSRYSCPARLYVPSDESLVNGSRNLIQVQNLPPARSSE
jgi:hypothetical protein